MKEMFLVGAVHGVSIQDRLFDMINHYEVSLPSNIRTDLFQGAHVAIELYPGALEEPRFVPDDDRYGHEKWTKGIVTQDILDRQQYLTGEKFFRDFGAMVLENDGFVHEIDDLRLSQVKLATARKMEDITRLAPYRETSELPTRHLRRFGHARTLLRHLDGQPREEKLFAGIANLKPDMAVIGMGHADKLAANRNIQKSLGITISEYVQIVPDIEAAAYSSRDSGLPSFQEIPTQDEIVAGAQRSTLEQELYKRRHNAYTLGRVLDHTARLPDYLGRFYNTNLAADSLFELHIAERSGTRFNGFIFDVLGDATVEGEIIPSGEISFKKQYVPERSALTVNKILHYTAEFDRRHDRFYGTYNDKYDGKWGYVFYARPYSPDVIRKLDTDPRAV